MEIFNSRHLYYIRGIQVIFLFAILSTTASAQLSGSKGNYNYFDFQKKPFYFGITLGLNGSSYKINHSKAFIGNDSIGVAESSMGPGFNVHIITNFKIGDSFDFRLLPGFSSTVRNLQFTSSIESSDISKKTIESYFFELPLHLRFKSAPYKDKRMYVVGGVKYSFDVASNSKSRQRDSLIKISPHDFQMEVGMGMQFFFKYFIFSPEIKFSRGLGNILIYNDVLNESRVLEQLNSQLISISFHFEG